MARHHTIEPDTEQAAQARVTELRDLLGDLPARIDAATDRGDSDELARLLVSERIIERQLATAEATLESLRLDRLRRSEDELASVLLAADQRVDELDLAANVYARAAERARVEAATAAQRVKAVRSELWVRA